MYAKLFERRRGVQSAYDGGGGGGGGAVGKSHSVLEPEIISICIYYLC